MEFKKTDNLEKYMFRYLMRYVGTYRVKAEYDETLGDFPHDENFEDLYIPCQKGVIKHTYLGKDILALCFYDKASQAKHVYQALSEKYPKLELEFEDDGADAFIYFNARNIKKVATICKPRTSGAGINPFSVKNLPKQEYMIPAKDLDEINRLVEGLTRIEKLHFLKSTYSDFYKQSGLVRKRKKSRLGNREFIHSVGMWDKYLKFVSKQMSAR